MSVWDFEWVLVGCYLELPLQNAYFHMVILHPCRSIQRLFPRQRWPALLEICSTADCLRAAVLLHLLTKPLVSQCVQLVPGESGCDLGCL